MIVFLRHSSLPEYKLVYNDSLLISCIQDLLKDKLVVLATHQVHFAMLANKLLVLKDVGSYCICNIIWWSKIITVAFTLAIFRL